MQHASVLSDVLIPDPVHPGHCHREAQHVNLCCLHLPPVFPSAPPSRLRAVRHTFILVDALLSHVADTLLKPVPTCSHTLLQQSCLFHHPHTSHNGKALMLWNKCKFVTEKKAACISSCVFNSTLKLANKLNNYQIFRFPFHSTSFLFTERRALFKVGDGADQRS